MTRRIHHLLTLGALALATAPAQAQTPPRILALTEATPFLAQIEPTTCNMNVCTPPFSPAVAPYAGGTAHDPRDRMTWISDGVMLMKVNARGTCAPSCPPITAPGLVAGSVVTGLAFNEETQQLFISYSDNRIATFFAVGCTYTFLSQCTPSVPPNHAISALATDDATGEIYYASSAWFGASSVPFGQIYRAPQSSPCTPVCPAFPVDDCTGILMFEITGMSYDSCRRELAVTDGLSLVGVTNTFLCQPLILWCCAPLAVLGERITGLCQLPSTEVSGGNACVSGTAPPCPGQHVLGGDPTIGNLGFSLDLINAPSGLAVLFLGLGPCAGPGTNYGILCNNVLPPYFNSTLTSGPPCGATASIPFPLPNLTVLCGITLCSQYAGLVPPGVSGTFVTNHLSWTITSS